MKFLFLKMAYWPFIILFQLLPYTSFNQPLLGLKVNYANNFLQANISNRSYTSLRNGNGIGFGILFNSKLNNIFNLQSSLEVVNKAYSFERLEAYQGIYEYHNNVYLQIPVLLEYAVLKGNKWSVMLNGGFYIGFWLQGRVKGSIPNIFNSVNDTIFTNGSTTQYLQLTKYSEKYQFNKERDKRLEIGWIPGVSLNYHRRKGFLTASVNYYHSLTSQVKNSIQSSTPFRLNRTVITSIGYSFDLHKII